MMRLWQDRRVSDLVTTVPSRSGTAGPPRRRMLLVMAHDEVRPHPLPLLGTLTIGRGSTCDVHVTSAPLPVAVHTSGFPPPVPTMVVPAWSMPDASP